MEPLKFKKNYYVHVYEMGPDGRLTIYSLFNYMQDIASDHAERLGFGRHDLMRDNRFWVLSRMYAEIKELPLWEDTIIIETWPNGTDKLFALRNYEIKTSEGKHIASASSSWLILDRDTRKIQRPDSILMHYNPYLHTGDLPVRTATKIDFPDEQGNMSRCFSIKPSDLDVNLHTNNTGYLKWAIDTYDLGFLMKNVPQSAEINYLAESKHGEEISIRTSSENHNLYNHSVIRVDDEKELCRIRLGWIEQRN